jgi:hypothetical protein
MGMCGGSEARRPDLWLGAAGAAAIVSLALLTSGRVDQDVTASGTWSEIAVTLAGLGACGAVVAAGARGRPWGGVTIALFAALCVDAALSVAWSVQPDWSWLGADQLLSYLAAFAGAAAIARVAPERWRGVLGAVTLACVALCGWALLVKVFPATLASGNRYGRLQAPFGYWNALGVAAAMGIPACLWVGTWEGGARLGGRLGGRLRGRLGATLAAPGLAILIAVLILSYSRSSLLAAVIGVGLWLALAPGRLRACLQLAVGAAGAAVIAGWALSSHGVSADNVAIGAQDAAGHTFGIALVVAVAGITAGGYASARAAARLAPSAATRRRIGLALAGLGGLAVLAAIGAVALSSRGLTGEISHAWAQLTNPNSTVGNSAGRITDLGSSRPLYWQQAMRVGEHHLLAGAGELGYAIARLRYSTSPDISQNAHSYVAQTFSDLGLIGVALSLALLVAWAVAAARAVGFGGVPGGGPRTGSAERLGLVAMGALAVTFGVQSTLDWTWYFPGVAIPALLCAGWLAGRGPLAAPVGRRAGGPALRSRPGAGVALTLLVTLALAGAWATWQPLHAAHELTASENAGITAGQAFADARAAASSDPFAYLPLERLAALYRGVGLTTAARAQLRRATARQPDNPYTWSALGDFDVATGDPRGALAAMRRVEVLDHSDSPTLIDAQQVQIEAEAQLGG